MVPSTKIPSEFIVRIASDAADVDQVRALWREYWKSIGLPDEFQGFGEELKGLPGVYARDGGALLLATHDSIPAGTIALRRLNDRAGEVKRLYLRPDWRGKGLGRYLIENIIEHARAVGYTALYADTLPIMTDALGLYARLGFERVEAYAPDPTPSAIFLKLQLC
jgi:GNAT superfamily N-acetyltransferase